MVNWSLWMITWVKTVLVNNWATWCPPCRAEMPTLQAYYNEHQHQNFTLVAIESGDHPSQVAEFTQQFNLTFPIWVDQEMKAIQKFSQPGFAQFLLDRQTRDSDPGLVRYHKPG